METFFPNKCLTFLLEETSRTTPTKARNNAKKNNSRDDTTNTTTTSSAGPFSDALLLCVCRSCVLLQSPFLFYTRERLRLRGVFWVSLCRPFGGRCTNDTKLHNTTHLVCFQKNDTNVSLSLCVFLVFLSASKSSSSVLRRSSFVVKGKERLIKNETLLEPSCVQARMWMRRRSPDWVETEIRTYDTNDNDRHRSETMSFDQKPMEPVETFLRPFVSSRVSSGFFLLGTKFRGRVESEKRDNEEDKL